MEERVCGWVCFWEQWNVFVPSNRNRSRDDKVEDCDESEKGKREEYRNMKENRKKGILTKKKKKKNKHTIEREEGKM